MSLIVVLHDPRLSIHRFDSYYKSDETIPRKGNDSYKENGGIFSFDEQELERQYKEDLTLDFQKKTSLKIDGTISQDLKFGVAARWKERNNDVNLKVTDDKGGVTNLTTDADRYHLTEDYHAAFVQNEIKLTDNFSVLPGIRMEHVKLRSRDGANTGASSTTTDWNPGLHLRYEPVKKLVFHGAVSRSVNRPQFDQLTPFRRIDDEIETGNPDLDPAKSINYDLGMDWHRKDVFLGDNVFYKDITNVIESVRTGRVELGRDLYQYQNVGTAICKGWSWTSDFPLAGPVAKRWRAWNCGPTRPSWPPA